MVTNQGSFTIAQLTAFKKKHDKVKINGKIAELDKYLTKKINLLSTGGKMLRSYCEANSLLNKEISCHE